MKSKINYKSINNIHGILKFFYYATIFSTITSIITTLSTLLLPDTAITFEKGIRGWFYSVTLPTGIGGSSFMIERSIPSTILQFFPIEWINIKAAIIIDSLFSLVLLLVIINIGLKKLSNLTNDILKGESPFQFKHTNSIRKISIIIVLYSTMKNTALCILFSMFVTDVFSVTFEFIWSGIIIGVLGYIFCDITEYGLFLQDEYDTTL